MRHLKILFFSGGSALADASRKLAERRRVKSTHIITPFDSGGSSAILRNTFDMPAVGDLRNRILSLADTDSKGIGPILKLLSYRFPKSSSNSKLWARLSDMCEGKDRLIKNIAPERRADIIDALNAFKNSAINGFDLRGASVGNLLMTGAYLANGRKIELAASYLSRLVNARGKVLPVVNGSYHLAAKLQNGETVVGQHKITGKEVAPPDSRIESVYLVGSLDSKSAVKPKVTQKLRKQILDADIIVYPVGSFYSSVIANLLPEGVGEAIVKSSAIKVYIPNGGYDPEQSERTIHELTDEIIRYASPTKRTPVKKVLNYILIDADTQKSLSPSALDTIEKEGVSVISKPLVTKKNDPYYDTGKLIDSLLDLFTKVNRGEAKKWRVYLVECADGTYYTGISNDIEKRLAKHNDGTGAKYTRGRGPVSLLAKTCEMSKGDALKIEAAVKRVRKEDKTRLIREVT